MFSDIDDLFGRNPVDNDVIQDIDDFAIRNSMKSLIMTSKGERPFLPLIGCNVKSFLFENASGSTPYAIARSVREVLQNFEPRVIVDKVDVEDDPERNKISIRIFYRIVTDLNIDRNITFAI
ncbi:baseplate wedge subunit and lysozyme [Paraglaciecola Antarctic GD virus 1]|nr:baseplate wedge subunit and lysozyme [Paraglaciecola Antarctic GD virus 1]